MPKVQLEERRIEQKSLKREVEALAPREEKSF